MDNNLNITEAVTDSLELMLQIPVRIYILVFMLRVVDGGILVVPDFFESALFPVLCTAESEKHWML